jgi:hypothetical protein
MIVMTKLNIHFPPLFILVVLILTSQLYGQSHDKIVNHEHGFKNFRIAVNLGHGYIPSATTANNKFVVLPVWGLDFQYWFNHKWGIALKNDVEIANYFIEVTSNSSENLERNNPVIISLPLLFSPWNNGFTFLLGPGIELESGHNFSIFRLGVGYEFELPGHWDFAPELVYDLKDGHINSLTLAIGIGKRF